jgi:hypothetical protein
MNIPKEVIYRHAFHTAAEYFAGKIADKRKAGLVPVFVEDTYETLYYMPCNEEGYPNYGQMKFLEVPRLQPYWLEQEASLTTLSNITVQEVTVYVDYPMLTQRYDWRDRPVVFMWHGKRMGIEHVPIDKLNVSELLRAVQAAVKNREGLVIDDALKNKIYK